MGGVKRRAPVSACRRLIRLHASGMLLAAATLAGAGCHRSAPPNILLYVVDTLRADALGCYGNSQVQTPAMDSLARDGIRFARAYADASWTRPSMGALLTGQYPTAHGAVGRNDALRAGTATLGSQLRARGYTTAAIVANPNIGSPFGFAEGFDEFVELYKPHSGTVRPEELVATADVVVDRTLQWLDAHTARPFFLLVFSVDPHAPYTPPPPYDRLYDAGYDGQVDGSFKSLLGLAMLRPAPPERDVRHARALYQGEVSFNDAQLQRLLTGLQPRGLVEQTLVVLTSDHGEEFYEHGGFDHGHSLYEELIHVPLLMRWPGTIAPAVVAPDVVQLVDLFPTLLHLAGGPPVTGPGRNLGAVLRGQKPDGAPPPAYAEENLDNHQLQALIAGRRKTIADAARPAPLVFDLAQDPGEHRPLPDPALQDLLALETIRNSTQAAAQRSAPRLVQPTELPDSVRQALRALGYGQPGKE